MQMADKKVWAHRSWRVWMRRQKPRGRLWLNDGFCIRLRPQHRNHVWSYDFVEAQTHDGRRLRLLGNKPRRRPIISMWCKVADAN